MTTVKKILCAIDLTKASRAAFGRALSIVRVSKAKLYVLHVVPANMPFSWRASDRLELLTELRIRAEREGVAVRVVEQHGDPARVIVLHATRGKPTSSSCRIQPPPRLAPVQGGLCRSTVCSAAPCVGSADCSAGHRRQSLIRT